MDAKISRRDALKMSTYTTGALTLTGPIRILNDESLNKTEHPPFVRIDTFLDETFVQAVSPQHIEAAKIFYFRDEQPSDTLTNLFGDDIQAAIRREISDDEIENSHIMYVYYREEFKPQDKETIKEINGKLIDISPMENAPKTNKECYQIVNQSEFTHRNISIAIGISDQRYHFLISQNKEGETQLLTYKERAEESVEYAHLVSAQPGPGGTFVFHYEKQDEKEIQEMRYVAYMYKGNLHTISDSETIVGKRPIDHKRKDIEKLASLSTNRSAIAPLVIINDDQIIKINLKINAATFSIWNSEIFTFIPTGTLHYKDLELFTANGFEPLVISSENHTVAILKPTRNAIDTHMVTQRENGNLKGWKACALDSTGKIKVHELKATINIDFLALQQRGLLGFTATSDSMEIGKIPSMLREYSPDSSLSQPVSNIASYIQIWVREGEGYMHEVHYMPWIVMYSDGVIEELPIKLPSIPEFKPPEPGLQDA